MRTFILSIIFGFISMQSIAQNYKKLDADKPIVSSTPVAFRLFSTQNMWTFIKLNTKNGQMWQVHFDIKGDSRVVAVLSSRNLVAEEEEEVEDRFSLHPTQNIYTFILIDQIDGRTWQVQWSMTPDERFIIPIF